MSVGPHKIHRSQLKGVFHMARTQKSVVPNFTLSVEENDQMIAVGDWLHQLSQFGAELLAESNVDCNFTRVIALSLPTKELATTAISLGIIFSHLESKIGIKTENTKISTDELQVGMIVSGFSGAGNRPFLAEVIDVNERIVQLRSNKTAKPASFLKSMMTGLELVSHQGVVPVGILPSQQDEGSRFWGNYLRDAPSAEVFQNPVVNLIGSKSDIESELSLKFSLKWDGGISKDGVMADIVCPIWLTKRPPYFTRIEKLDDSDNVMEDENGCKINIYTSLNAIKNNLSPRDNALHLFLIARNDINAKTCSSLIEGKYAHSMNYHPEFGSLKEAKWAELLSYGVKK